MYYINNLIFNFLMSSTCFETEGSSSGRRLYRVTQKNGNFRKNPPKIEEIQEKKNLLIEIEPLQLAF